MRGGGGHGWVAGLPGVLWGCTPTHTCVCHARTHTRTHAPCARRQPPQAILPLPQSLGSLCDALLAQDGDEGFRSSLPDLVDCRKQVRGG